MNRTFNESFHRSIIFSNIPLTGAYRYKDIFQIIPGKSEWPSLPQFFDSSRPIILEYNSELFKPFKIINENYSVITDYHGDFKFKDYNKEIRALLTLVCNCNFYLENKYCLTDEELGENYFLDYFMPTDTDNMIKKNSHYIFEKVNVLGDVIIFPENSDLFFKSYYSLNIIYLNRFRMSLMLYYNAIYIREYSPSMCYLALVSAIENLVDLEGEMSDFKPEKCECCNQNKYKLNRRFKDFMLKYCLNKSKESRKFLEEVYNKRSHVAHLGKLFYYDYAKSGMDIKGDGDINILKLCVRIALYRWVLLNTVTNGENSFLKINLK